MTELEVAACDWKQICEQVALDNHPYVWVGHYRGQTPLGSVYGQPVDEALAVVIYGSPFAVSDVMSTFVFIDRPNRILATRLEWVYKSGSGGVQITDWDLPYAVGDRFDITFGVAEKRPHPDNRIKKACNDLADHRLAARLYDFNTAFWYSVEKGKLI